VRILATSREGLGVADEQRWPVASLDVGAGIESAAANLFVDRARSVDSGFLVADQAAAVVEVCRRLDGIPLAIELAASRMQSMTATEVRDRLGDRFRLLVGSRRGLERHQTLRHAVAWSYDLLDDGERSVLNQCSVFAGGFDLAGAQAVTGSDDDFATLDLLDALVRKSLLVAEHSSGRTRFSMLETIRQFAEEQLAVTGEATEARTAHARHFATREADIMSLWDSPRQREAYEWFTAELANLRTAFRWAADQGDLDVAATIATYAGFLGFLAEIYEPIAWAEELIEPCPRRRSSPARISVCNRVAVLGRGTDRGGCRLQRRRPDGSRQRPRRGALRHRGLARQCIPLHRPARTVGRVVPCPTRILPRCTHEHHFVPGYGIDDRGSR
jgi:predicted ATPase